MEKNWLEIFNDNTQIEKIIKVNEKSKMYGLTLTSEDAKYLILQRKEELKDKQRVEFGDSILPDLIFAFCDSQYISQSNFVDTIVRLQEIFYEYKNETMDILTDEELIDFMKKSFDGKCEGDLDYLSETVMDKISREIRHRDQDFLKRRINDLGYEEFDDEEFDEDDDY